jgi:hypothetical protein
MQILSAIFFGLSSGVGAVLLHQSLPPFGLILGLLLSFFSIWYVGRYSGKRIYKVLAAFIWVAVIVRAGSFGVGQELLIQGDAIGAALMVIGLITVVLAAIRRV